MGDVKIEELNEAQMIAELKRQIAKHRTAVAVAKALGVPESRISEALAGKGVRPQLAQALGYVKEYKAVFRRLKK